MESNELRDILNGYFGDTSRMYRVGTISSEAENLLQITQECLNKAILEVRPEKYFGDTTSFRKGILDGLLNSDGSKKRNSYTFSTTSQQLIVDLNRLCVTLGKVAKFNKSKPKNEIHNECYKIMILNRSTSPRIWSKRNEIIKRTYNGNVYCATSTTGLLLVRRNGCQLICGNSPFRHVQFTFMCQLPEIVTRQFYKHVVGIAYSEHGTREIDHAWNEVSGRYIEATKLGFWIPDALRLQSKSNKQGSVPDLGGVLGPNLIQDMIEHNERSEALYAKLIAAGVAKELARSVLTTSFNTKFIWTCSLQALVNFIKLRLHVHAQKEIQMVAEILLELARPICPISIDALLSDSP